MERITDNLKDEMRKLKKGDMEKKRMMGKELNESSEKGHMETYTIITMDWTNQHQRNEAGP